MSEMIAVAPSVDAVRANRVRLGDRIMTTPIRLMQDDAVAAAVGASTRVWLKEEQFQHTGSFKPRGTLTVMQALSPDVLARGVTAFSAGNHAMSVAFCARLLGTTATVVMPRSANAFRVERCRALGATVELVDDIHAAFVRVREIEAHEQRTFVHPFEGPETTLGTASLGLEFLDQMDAVGEALDAVIVAAGGGGLLSGVASYVKQRQPSMAVYAVEPEGADSFQRSRAAGTPQKIEAVRTIADSLGAPGCAPYSFAINQAYVTDAVLVADAAIRDAMRLLFQSAKLVVEPAGAAALAALMGPLRARLDGARVGVVVCGANVDVAAYVTYLTS